MKICQNHWDRLRQAVEDRGIGHLGARDAQSAFGNMVTDLEGRSAENNCDPLMACNYMIWSKGLEVLGLELMSEKDRCPICEALKAYEEWWISGPADAVLEECKEQGLI